MTAQSPIFTTPASIKQGQSRLEFDSRVGKDESEQKGG